MAKDIEIKQKEWSAQVLEHRRKVLEKNGCGQTEGLVSEEELSGLLGPCWVPICRFGTCSAGRSVEWVESWARILEHK